MAAFPLHYRYIKASAFGLSGIETPAQLNGNKALLAAIEKLRGLICVKIGLVEKWEDAIVKIPYQPFVSLVSEPAGHTTYTGHHIAVADTDINARMYLMGEVVKAYPGTGTANLGFCARVTGSLVNTMLGDASKAKQQLGIGHPTGIIYVNSIGEQKAGENIPAMENVSFIRTARVLLDGIAYVRSSVLYKETGI